MSKIEGEKRYFWIKLKEDFFDEDTISWLEEQENGKEYCLFYLKLCLKSLKDSNFVIQRKVGELYIPYETKKIAEMTNTNEDIAKQAIEKLKQVGYIQVLDSGGLYMTQVQYMVGSETKSAVKKRNYRAKKAGQSEDKEETTRGHTEDKARTERGQGEDNVPSMSQTMSDRYRDRERDKSLDIDLDEDIDNRITERDIMFNAFWFEYPKQYDKEGTYKEWVKVVSIGYSEDELIQSAKNYCLEVVDYSPKYIKHPKNFFVDKTFIDYLPSNYNFTGNVIPISSTMSKEKQEEFKKRMETIKALKEYRTSQTN